MLKNWRTKLPSAKDRWVCIPAKVIQRSWILSHFRHQYPDFGYIFYYLICDISWGRNKISSCQKMTPLKTFVINICSPASIWMNSCLSYISPTYSLQNVEELKQKREHDLWIHVLSRFQHHSACKLLELILLHVCQLLLRVLLSCIS